MSSMISRRFFIGGAASFGAFGGCRFLNSNNFRAGGTPNVRFGVISDIHITKVGADEKMAANGNNLTFKHTLEWFRDQNVDAVMIAGDMADKGTDEHIMAVAQAWYSVFPEDRYPDGRPIEKVFVYGNHDWHGHNYGSHSTKLYPDVNERVKHILQADMAGWWKKAFHEDYSILYSKNIKGYTFIGCHWDRGSGFPKGDSGGVDPFTLLPAFMDKHGGDIDPTLPFFYVQHPHPKDTCYGPWAWGHDRGVVTKCLSSYQNAIAFSGHSHYSLTDERSIWQGAFTSVGTSSLRYTGMPYNEHLPIGYENTSTEGQDAWRVNAVKMMPGFSGAGDCRQGMLWSVYDDCIVVKRREFLSDMDVGDDWVMPLPSAESRPFAFAEHARKFEAPRFAEGASLTVKAVKAKSRGGKSPKTGETIASTVKPSVSIVAPQTVPDKNARLYDLEFAVESKSGERKAKLIMAEGFNHALAHARTKLPVSCVFAKDELPKPPFRFIVTPRNCFGKSGVPLTTDWHNGI